MKARLGRRTTARPSGPLECYLERVPFRTFLSPFLSANIVLCIANLCTAATLPVLPSAQVEQYLSEKLTLWQKRLDLENWTITIVMCSPSALRGGTLGSIHWDPEKKTAVIRVLEGPASVREKEFTLVHELIHLEFSDSTRSDDASRAREEASVNHIAEALLELDHKTN